MDSSWFGLAHKFSRGAYNLVAQRARALELSKNENSYNNKNLIGIVNKFASFLVYLLSMQN